MRIRKRQALLSSSSLSPLPLSDPNLVNRSPVVVQLVDATHTASKPSPPTSLLSQHQHAAIAAPSSLDRCQPSDQTLQLIGKPNNGCDDLSGIGESGAHNKQQQHPLEEKGRGQESGDSGEKGNHTSKGDILVSQVFSSSSSFPQDGRWCEGEKAIPLKKRRGSFENGMENSQKMKPKMKTKMNKKCSMQKGEEDEEEDDKEELKRNHHETKKKRTRGSAVMEGSRCSRVNGRGWRCCQQTLVGYSLCEHHLGKGRLRSMTSVRNRSSTIGSSTTTTTAPSKKVHNNLEYLSVSVSVSGDSSSSNSLEKQTIISGIDHDALENDEKKPVIITKKRMKLGMVKARSMSSLLGQTNIQLAVAEENNK